MKKTLNILLILALSVIYSSCSNEVDDVFDKSSALRMQEALENYKTVLTTPGITVIQTMAASICL